VSSRKGKGRGKGRAHHHSPAAAHPPADTPSAPDLPASDPAPEPVTSALASEALRSIVDEVVARAERVSIERALPPSVPIVPRPPAGWLAAAAFSWLLVLLSLVRPPAVLEGPRPVTYAPPPALVEASDRYALWLAAGRIERFLAREGRLPSFLGETGFEDARVQYRVTGESTWMLELSAGGSARQLAAGTSRDELLGDALDQLQSNR
jgi:hypothetical protein